MAKIVDITDKLTFDGNPKMIIKGEELEVNADAPTMLKVMGLMGDSDPGVKEISDTYDLLFPDKSKKVIETLKLGFSDLIIVVQEAMTLIVGDNNRGE